MTTNDGRFLGAGSAAQILGVTPQSVRHFSKAGLLRSIPTDIGFIFARADVEKLAEERAARKDRRGAVQEASAVVKAVAPTTQVVPIEYDGIAMANQQARTDTEWQS